MSDSRKIADSNGKTATISVITATYNAIGDLPRLIQSLRAQTDRDFEWVVADGASTDGTLDLLQSIGDLNVIISSQPDFGIYDAVNRGVKICSGKYYLVVGADDRLTGHAIERYRSCAVDTGYPDMVAAVVMCGARIIRPRARMGWYLGMPGVASCHSVGLMIKKSLHEIIGLYSRDFPIAADQLFVKTALNKGASIVRREFIAGEFSLKGRTGSDYLGVLTEVFRIQVKTERWVLLQYVLFICRCVRYYVLSSLSSSVRR